MHHDTEREKKGQREGDRPCMRSSVVLTARVLRWERLEMATTMTTK